MEADAAVPAAASQADLGRTALARIVKYIEDVLDLPVHDREGDSPVANCTPIPVGADMQGQRRLSAGLHLDTNHRPMRCATAIIYLSSLPKAVDGATVFPVAGCSDTSSLSDEARRFVYGGAEPLVAAAASHSKDPMQAMLPVFQHTDRVLCKKSMDSEDDDSGESTVDARATAAADAAKTLVDAADAGACVSIWPEMGKLMLFFTRGPDGSADPLSLHGGADVLADELRSEFKPLEGKWTIIIFREVPLRLPELGELASKRERQQLIRLRSAASGTAPLLPQVEDIARRGARSAREAALGHIGLTEATLGLACSKMPYMHGETF
eukprot:TRINITY_DN31724_c0_g1_i2.p1 TRINITY_DN31724_c0_g1~~TRINITY_DN31724_c0_g1_i2.p1  ORF type:complete len:325 (-),score=58.57 TRINITY_DN31724_c0_g1_i2:63-1037(-)